MKRILLVLASLTLLTSACGLTEQQSTPTPQPALDTRCGDGICEGPENPQNCPADCPPTPQPTPEGEGGPYTIINPASDAALHVAVFYPPGWDSETRLQALIFVPGGSGDSERFLRSSPDGLMVDTFTQAGYAIVLFDPDGRGQSGGTEDYNGFVHQDGLAEVIRFAATLPGIDLVQIGLVTFSYGITMGAGTLARHPDLPISFLVDWEGPADRNDTGGCDEAGVGHLNAVASCDDEDFWAEREASAFIGQIRVPYQRIQSARDHVQPDNDHAIQMVNNAVAGGVPWVRLNDLPPNQTYDAANPPPMIPVNRSRALSQLMLDYVQAMFTLTTESTATAQTSTTIPPIYVTVALHIEAVPVYANCQAYPDYRRNLLRFAEAMAPYGAKINLQTEYEFLVGVDRCETPAMQAETNGQNVLDYLASHYGYEIDAHRSGGWDLEAQHNYADVRYLAGRLTTATSENVGGLVWDDPAQWATLTQGERGLLYPDFVWRPEALTLATGTQHHLGDFTSDDYASGVWRPKGAGPDFWVHDPQGPLIYVGPGEYDNWGGRHGRRPTLDFLRDLLAKLEAGAIERDVIYTASLAVPQSVIFNPDEHARLQTLLEQLAPLVTSGQVVYVTYSQAVMIWQTEYGAEPNIYLER